MMTVPQASEPLTDLERDALRVYAVHLLEALVKEVRWNTVLLRAYEARQHEAREALK